MRRERKLIMAAAVVAVLGAGCSAPDDGAGTASDGGVPVEEGLAAQHASTDRGAARDGITVVGSGIASGEPDVVRIVVGVEVRRDDVQQALDDANAATEQVLQVLDDEGIADEDRQTRDFSVRQAYRGEHDGVPRIEGYTVRNLVEATVRDVERVGAVIQSAADAAGDDARVQGVSFALEDDGEQLLAAREAAFADARDKAEQYARLNDAELGELVAIEERDMSTPRRATMDEAADAAASSVPIEAGRQDVAVHVTVRWSLR